VGRGHWSNAGHVDNTWPAAALTAGSEARYSYATFIRYPQVVPPAWVSNEGVAMTFGTEKLEWCGYPMVKKF